MGNVVGYVGKKCYLLIINNKSSHFYMLDNHILQQVKDNPYYTTTSL